MKEAVHEKTVWGNYYWCWVTGSVFNTSRWVVFEIQSILLGLAKKDVSKWYEYRMTIDNERCWVPEEMLTLGKGKFLPHGIRARLIGTALPGGNEECPWWEWP